MNVLKPFKKTTVLTLFQNGVSQHEIARKTGVDRKTIRKIISKKQGFLLWRTSGNVFLSY